MARVEFGISNSIHEILAALNLAGLNLSVVQPDGVTHGFMTTHKDINPDGSETLWSGMRREGDCFRFDVSDGQVYDVYGGDQLLLRLNTEQEAKAYLFGILHGFTGRNVDETMEAIRALTEDDPYRRMAELHKSGMCPVWNGWEHYSTERR